MRLPGKVTLGVVAGITGFWGLPCASAQKAAPKATTYRVIYRLPTITRAMLAGLKRSPFLLDTPCYALGGKAVVFEDPSSRKITVVAGGKTKSFPRPADAELFEWGRQSPELGAKLLCYTVRREDWKCAVHSIDLTTGKSETLCRPDLEDFYSPSAFLSPDGRLLAEHEASEPDEIKILNVATGRRLPSFKPTGYVRILAWSKASDGLYLLRSDRVGLTDLLLWKVVDREPSQVAHLDAVIDPEQAALAPSDGKLVWIDRNWLNVTDLASGKTARIEQFDGDGSNLRVSPSGRYVIMDYHSKNSGERFQVYDLSVGKSYTCKLSPRPSALGPVVWHPTQDRLLAVYAYSEAKLELREYSARELINYVQERDQASLKKESK